MPRFVGYVRRAFELPPRQALRAATEIAVAATSAWRQRALGILTLDAVGSLRFGRLVDRDRHGARLFARPDAVLPVRWMSPAASSRPPGIREAAAAAIAHRFDLLGSGNVRVSYALRAAGVDGHRYEMPHESGAADRQRRRMEMLLPGSSSDYDPIDWHVDFKSGYRWPSAQWFSRVQFGRQPGVDVKVPWELSRFQHAGPLGLAYRLEPESPEGRRAAAEFRSQVVDWIAANPVGHGVNWVCAMDVALRAVNWLIGLALLDGAPELDADFRWLLAKSLHAHGRHVEANLEYHRDKTGNHYLANVVGLLCMGAALPEVPESDRWCAFGLQELAAELERQVLPDGVDIEGSIPYHHLIAELFLVGTLVALRLDRDRRTRLQRAAPGRLKHPFAPPIRPPADQTHDLDRAELYPAWYFDRLLRMAEFSHAVTRPDGRVPQIGDNDNGRAYRIHPTSHPCDRRTVLAVASRVFGRTDLVAEDSPFAVDAALLVADAPVNAIQAAVRQLRTDACANAVAPRRFTDDICSLTLFETGGFAVVRAGQLQLVISLAAVPLASTGGHFHNDLLGFDLQWDGVDFIVDGGTYLYTPFPSVRDEYRATAAHNTVAVDGCEQRTWPAHVGHLFSVQHDASVRVLAANARMLAAEVCYQGIRHVRTLSWSADELRVQDRLDASRPASLTFNLHPGVSIAAAAGPSGESHVSLECRRRTVAIEMIGVREPVLRTGCYSEGYGRRISNRRLCASMIGTTAISTLVFGHTARAVNCTEQLKGSGHEHADV